MTRHCPTCALPLVWSHDRQQMWCAVYGTHPAYQAPPLLTRPNRAVVTSLAEWKQASNLPAIKHRETG